MTELAPAKIINNFTEDSIVKHIYKASITATLFLSISTAAHAQVQYTLTDIGSLGGTSTTAAGINNLGQVVGGSYTAGGVRHAFMYDGSMHDLGTLGGDSSYASSINSSGQIVGSSYTASSPQANHAFMYDGVMHDLHSNFSGWGDSSVATAINDAGQIVGSTYTSVAPGHTGFLLNNGAVSHLYGANGVPEPSAINSLGVIAGNSSFTSSINDVHAYVYSNGTITALGALGGAWSRAAAMNDAGVIIGEASIENIQYGARSHAFLYNGSMHDLGTLGGDNSAARGINAMGLVVGESLTGTGLQHAFLYDGSTMFDLNNLLLANLDGVTLSDAYGINASGQIIANGTNGHAYLLSAVPVPAAVWLFGSSLFGLTAATRRKSTVN